jgi:probable addiction module antidote protein
MKRAIPHREYLMKHLAAPEEAAAYLDSVAEDGDIGFLLKALRQVVEAQGGVGALAKRTRLSRTSLYKTLSSAGNPEVGTLDAILAVYGIRLGFFPAKPAGQARRSAWHAAHDEARHPGPMLGL